MYNNDGILIKGNRDGINTTIYMDKFDCFDDMLTLLVKKLSKGKHFYKGMTLILRIDLSLIADLDIKKLNNTLLDKIELKDIALEDLQISNEPQVAERKNKIASCVHEGKTKFIRKTVRSGQILRYQGNIVIIGDINSGAEVYASGNVIVLGTIKGKVTAGMYGNNEAVIAAFLLQPEILKIADVITMSPDDNEKPSYPEIAKIKDGIIIVEPYLPNKYIY